MKYMLALVLSIGLVGCATTDPYTGEKKTSNTAKGAGIGAVAGAVLGAATGDKEDRGERAVKGALIGGAIGGGVGNYMDRQEDKLRKELKGTGVQVKRDGDKLQLIMPGNITFATNSSDIRPDFYKVLNSVAKVLAEFDQTSIRITGHTDSTGSDSINQPLSERRASSVGAYLRGQKVSGKRIQSYGYGSRSPVASNDTAAGREANRRVELELIPNEKQS